MTKSARGLVLAAGLSLVTGVSASAQDAPVALGSQATTALTDLFANAPVGSVTLATVPFTTGNMLQLANGQSTTYTVSYQNAQAVYLLVNTANTYWWYQGNTVGRVHLTFAGGTSQDVDLTVGGNVREWRIGAGYTVDTVTDPATTQAWSGTALAGGTGVLDMLTVTIPTTSNTLTGISLTNLQGWGNLRVLLSGVTVAYKPFTRPGNSATTAAASNSQAQLHAESANFTGVSPSQGKSAHSADAGMNTPATKH